MILIYGDKQLATRYYNFLNSTKQFENIIYIVGDDEFELIKPKSDFLKVITKVFICDGKDIYKKAKEKFIDFGFKQNQIFPIDDIMMKLSYILYDLQYNVKDPYILSFLLANFKDIQKIHSSYLIDKYDMKQRYDIAFSFTSKGHETHIIDLAYELEKKYNVLNIFTSDNDIYNLKNSIHLDGDNVVLDVTRLESLRNYDILISSNAIATKNSISVAISHTLTTKPVGRFHLFQDYAKCDYNCIQNTAVFNVAKDILKEYQHLLKKEVCLVPFGYPKLDKVINDLKQYKAVKKDSICYAPTIIMHNKEFTDTLSLNDGVYIVEQLLKNFPKYMIIFRPHPKTIEYNAGKEYLEDILSKFSNHPNFLYDNDSYHIKTFSRTKLLISDFSGVAQTFAFATNQPVLSLSKKGFNKQYKKVLKGKDIRKKFGLVLNDSSKLVKKVKYILKNQDKFSKKIDKYKRKQMFNLGKTTQYLIDNIGYIKSGKKHPDWFYIGPKES